MKVKYLYQIPLEYKGEIEYQFAGDKITVTMPDGVSDVFDFSGISEDGQIDANYETVLPVKAVIEAVRNGGEWYITLLQFVPAGTDVCPMNDASLEGEWEEVNVIGKN